MRPLPVRWVQSNEKFAPTSNLCAELGEAEIRAWGANGAHRVHDLAIPGAAAAEKPQADPRGFACFKMLGVNVAALSIRSRIDRPQKALLPIANPNDSRSPLTLALGAPAP